MLPIALITKSAFRHIFGFLQRTILINSPEVFILAITPSSTQRVAFRIGDDPFTMKFAVSELTFIFSAIVPMENTFSIDKIVMKMTCQSSLSSFHSTISFFFTPDKLSKIFNIFVFVSQLSIAMHQSIFELSTINLIIFSIHNHKFRWIFFLLLDSSTFFKAMFHSISESANILPSITKLLSSLAMRFIVKPFSFIPIA